MIEGAEGVSRSKRARRAARRKLGVVLSSGWETGFRALMGRPPRACSAPRRKRKFPCNAACLMAGPAKRRRISFTVILARRRALRSGTTTMLRQRARSHRNMSRSMTLWAWSGFVSRRFCGARRRNRRERCERSWRKMRGVTVSFIRHPDQGRGIPRRICRS